MLCLTLNGSTMQENYTILAQNEPYVQMLELRIDTLNLDTKTELEAAKAFPSRTKLPVILTCRRKTDGGNFAQSERKRLWLLKKVAAGAFSYIDLEVDTRKPDFEQQLKYEGKKIIKSFHSFDGLPENLELKISHIIAKGDIPKVAIEIKGIKELIELFKLGKKFEKVDEKIIIGMGKYGLASRILYRKLGSMLTFCSSYDPQSLGLISAKTMKELYRADEVSSSTRVFGIIGDPVGKSQSPQIQNLGFKALNIDAVYVPFNVDDVRAFFVLADLLEVQGFSVTLPHKVHVLPYLGQTSREVRRIGSCNTVVRKASTWWGSNTDYYGFLSLIQKPLETGQLKNALVLGAGGAARAIVWALKSNNVNVTILNRTLEHAKTLAVETGSNYGPLSNVNNYSGKVDLVVQTSSMGMDCSPEPENDPAQTFTYTGSELVCDLVYRPHDTAFLKHAQKAGCKILHGIEVLLAQGKLQFKAFVEEDYPLV